MNPLKTALAGTTSLALTMGLGFGAAGGSADMLFNAMHSIDSAKPIPRHLVNYKKHIIREETYTRNEGTPHAMLRRKELHATKGWRDYRA